MMPRLASMSFAIALLLASAIAAAQVTIAPAAPTPLDTITIAKPFGNEDRAKTLVTMSGNHVTVTLKSLDVFFPEPPPGTLVVPVGRLPAGTYQVDVVSGDASPATLLASFTVKVAPRAAGQPVDDYTDMWWNPSESGWGIDIAQHADGQLFATWFAYAADGSPTWYVVPGGHWTGGFYFQGDIYRTTGVNMAVFTPDAVTRTKVGTASFLFGPGGLRVDLEVDGKHVVRTLQRQSF
jgi:hypothetical protein